MRRLLPSRLLPKSLFGQTLLILLAGLIVSNAVGAWLYTSDRAQAVRAIGGFAAAQRIANLTRLVRDAPPDWRGRIVAALSDQTFHVMLTDRPLPPHPGFEDVAAAQAVKTYLTDQMSDGAPNDAAPEPRVVVYVPGGPPFGGFRPGFGHGPMMHGLGGFRELQVAMPLPDGQWLSFATGLPFSGPGWSRQFLVSMAVMAVIILGASIWAVRRLTAPLGSLSEAAERLGRDVNAPPLPETGTIETRQASRAFNDMQVRLRNLIENRTCLLAAISHDLRTPLTLLRLRAENVADAQERDKMLATIGEMDEMIGATLKFARDEAATEPARKTDIVSLVQSIVDDMGDAGLSVTMEPAQPIVCECRPATLKRALTNLIDNAVKYGQRAHVTVQKTGQNVEITIDDEGPGIPEAALSRVFEPFYRVEESRSRETGGVGLGLAIALSVVQAHGGKITLSNRPQRGLRARVTLPA
jgi:signal transduction histidine kinase